jgi:hypothetical protein
VFPSRRGGYLPLGEARWEFDKATAAVDGCGGVRLHDLRHTCASLAIRSGANVKVVQRLLGHKSAVLTPDRYGHLFPDDLDAVAQAFDAAADGCGIAYNSGNAEPTLTRPDSAPQSDSNRHWADFKNGRRGTRRAVPYWSRRHTRTAPVLRPYMARPVSIPKSLVARPFRRSTQAPSQGRSKHAFARV